jgi:hypothetical protein
VIGWRHCAELSGSASVPQKARHRPSIPQSASSSASPAFIQTFFLYPEPPDCRL